MSSKLRIGRGQQNDISLGDPFVSREHAVLSMIKSGLVIQDLDSKFGTFVNGERIESASITSTDAIVFGGRERLDWEDPIVKQWLASNRVANRTKPEKAPGSRKAVPWKFITSGAVAAGLIAVLLFVYPAFLKPSGDFSETTDSDVFVEIASETVITEDTEASITTEGIEIAIPVGALPASTEVSVEELPVEDAVDEMLASETFASPIYDIEASTHSFTGPVEIRLEYDPALVGSDELAIPAYWNGEIWVHVAGSYNGNTITVETDHFSFWGVLIARWVYNELTDWVYDACTAFFAPEEDKWTVEYDNWLQIQGSLDTFLGELPEVDSISVTGNTVLASVIVDGTTYSIVETSLPAFVSAGNYSQSSNQLGVIDSTDRLVNDPEILFKALYAYRLREYLGRIDLNAQADQLEESSSSLGTMHFWHGAISGTDIVQSLLSKILVHVSTRTAPSPAELLNPAILIAVEGIVCRTEMERFADDMMSLSGDFRSCNPAQMSYEELSSLACRSEGTLYRIDALTAFMRGTCPGLEANWFIYTAKKVLSDYLSIFIQKEAAHLAHTATHLINFDDALYAAKLSTLYQIAGSSVNIKGAFDLLVHTFNISGSNPMVEYYNAIQRPTNELSSTDHPSFSILLECAYLVEMIDEFNFIKVGDVITDYQTDLQWRVGPDTTTNWDDASSWVNILGGSWRMPVMSELQWLSEAGIGQGSIMQAWGRFSYGGYWVSEGSSRYSIFFFPVFGQIYGNSGLATGGGTFCNSRALAVRSR